jgi:hypothetical protein
LILHEALSVITPGLLLGDRLGAVTIDFTLQVRLLLLHTVKFSKFDFTV